MLQRQKHTALILTCTLCVSWWGILNGQTVPVGTGDAGTVPIGTLSQFVSYDSLYHGATIDSLELCILQIEISKAEEKVNETNFWRRLIPQIHLSTSLGMNDLMFIDPASFTPYILPRDAYRLTCSISLNEVLISPTHTQAIIELERLKVTLSLRTLQTFHTRKLLGQQYAELQEQSKSLERELSIVQDLLHFNELRFQQGRIEYDALARTRLELLAVQRSIQKVRQQQSEMRLKLFGQ